MVKEPRISISSDYAVLKAGDFNFYYGYEYGQDEFGEIWGFRVKEKDQVIFEYPVGEDRFDVTERLLEGIGNWLMKGRKP